LTPRRRAGTGILHLQIGTVIWKASGEDDAMLDDTPGP
jgi:hypothetical protein